MRHDLRLFGKTGSEVECVAFISIYADDPKEFDQQVAHWAPLCLWFVNKPGRPEEVAVTETISVTKVENIQPPQQQVMALPPGLGQLFGGIFQR